MQIGLGLLHGIHSGAKSDSEQEFARYQKHLHCRHRDSAAVIGARGTDRNAPSFGCQSGGCEPLCSAITNSTAYCGEAIALGKIPLAT
jgi:hypothetical protein